MKNSEKFVTICLYFLLFLQLEGDYDTVHTEAQTSYTNTERFGSVKTKILQRLHENGDEKLQHLIELSTGTSLFYIPHFYHIRLAF